MLKIQQVAMTLLLVVLAVLMVLVAIRAQSGQWMTVMLTCGGALHSAGEHITLHDSPEAARAHGDSELQSGRYDIAYVEERAGQFYDLRWVKSTSERCYGGMFREWSDDF